MPMLPSTGNATPSGMSAMDIARAIFPGQDDQFLDWAIWNQTGFPSFWPPKFNSPERALTAQLRRLRRTLSAGKVPCDMCGARLDQTTSGAPLCPTCKQRMSLPPPSQARSPRRRFPTRSGMMQQPAAQQPMAQNPLSQQQGTPGMAPLYTNATHSSNWMLTQTTSSTMNQTNAATMTGQGVSVATIYSTIAATTQPGVTNDAWAESNLFDGFVPPRGWYKNFLEGKWGNPPPMAKFMVPPGWEGEIKLANGVRFIGDANGGFTLDEGGKITRYDSAPLAFNRFINASDLLSAFAKFAGKEADVGRSEFMQLPLHLFIHWLVLEAAARDGIEPPADVPLAIPFRKAPPAPRCGFCQRYIPHKLAALGLTFCNDNHYKRRMERIAA